MKISPQLFNIAELQLIRERAARSGMELDEYIRTATVAYSNLPTETRRIWAYLTLGFSDAEIAGLMKLPNRVVSETRRALGLKAISRYRRT